MHISRRKLLTSTALAGISTLILHKAKASGTTTPSQVATDANLIATGLLAVNASLQNLQPPIAPATLAKIAGYLTTVQADAATIAAQTTHAGTTVAGEFIDVVEAVAPIIIGLFPGGGAVVGIAQAAISLLPSVATAFGLTGAKPGAPAPVFSPDNARLTLAAAKTTLAK